MKIKGLLIGILMTLTLGTITSYAADDWEVYFYYDGESVLMPVGTSSNEGVYHPGMRGSLISTAISRISNIGGGDIEISLETQAHVDVDEIRQQAYLDQWDEKTQDWYTVDMYSDVAYGKDYPNGLGSLKSTFVIHGQKTGYYYRARGMHKVTKSGQGSQTFSSRTDGVLITK